MELHKLYSYTLIIQGRINLKKGTRNILWYFASKEAALQLRENLTINHQLHIYISISSIDLAIWMYQTTWETGRQVRCKIQATAAAWSKRLKSNDLKSKSKNVNYLDC